MNGFQGFAQVDGFRKVHIGLAQFDSYRLHLLSAKGGEEDF